MSTVSYPWAAGVLFHLALEWGWAKKKRLEMANVTNSSFDYSPCHQIWESMAAGIALPTHRLPGIHHKNKWERRKTFRLGFFLSAHFVSCDSVSKWLRSFQESHASCRKPQGPTRLLLRSARLVIAPHHTEHLCVLWDPIPVQEVLEQLSHAPPPHFFNKLQFMNMQIQKVRYFPPTVPGI